MNVILSHVIILGIGSLIFLASIFAFTGINSNFSAFIREDQISEICIKLQGSIGTLIQKYNQSGMRTNEQLMGSIALNLPEKLGGKIYYLSSFNNSVKIYAENISAECSLGIPISGKSSGKTLVKIYSTYRVELIPWP